MGILNALSYGGITAVIGMFIVFLGLTILICAVKIMGAVFATVTTLLTVLCLILYLKISKSEDVQV